MSLLCVFDLPSVVRVGPGSTVSELVGRNQELGSPEVFPMNVSKTREFLKNDLIAVGDHRGRGARRLQRWKALTRARLESSAGAVRSPLRRPARCGGLSGGVGEVGFPAAAAERRKESFGNSLIPHGPMTGNCISGAGSYRA